MKIAICAQTKAIESAVDARFGRTGCFVVYDDTTQQWDLVDNVQNLQAAQGAGIQAAQTVIDIEADVLLACNVGPKAMVALTANEIAVYQTAAGQNVQQAVQEFTAGKLIHIQQANVEGHWV